MIMPAMQGMLSGMLIMIVPAFLVCSAIAIVAYRRRSSTSRD
ncbi:MAG TPA: hypothetical protein VGG84_00275 [Gemmatimonadaceae bacterium]|jgi:hypothetical protein